MKNIGIIGSGIVARTLGEGFLSHNYNVMLGTRDESKLRDWIKGNGFGAKTGSFSDSAKFGDLIILATKGSAAKKALEIAKEENFKGKIIIDTTNPIADSPPENGVLKYFTKMNESLMEDLQRTFVTASFVKAFNSVGAAFMVNPDFNSEPTMFICGNNDESKTAVSLILKKFGWEVEDFGKIESARAIESLCMLWCIPVFSEKPVNHAFKLLKVEHYDN